ncbi:SDR family oxidoreductase [Georgenia sp. EYE_87]|uniref:SDR family NAD(P)-dependent oxidoreductase n=1 Tax=Georgenia sp. EYE_87 TaxID=2853448 RepID=UPI002004D6BB|nr:SDR family NAD(P)-dependent oxidoreductase [Georgenia sp. EYE_87]MCK6210092.1 SDR family oxidoreductase [Georgenia sp. EYE_87]
MTEKAIALVTGAGGGLGSVVSRRLSEAGFHILLVDVETEGLERIAQTLPGSWEIHQCDVTDEGSVSQMMGRIGNDNGHLDVLVNNAGIESGALLADLSAGDWRRIFEVNVTGPFLLARAALPIWRRTRTGTIVNISSRTWLSGGSDAAYVSSKAALVGLTRALASELGYLGVTSNAVAPGFVKSQLSHVKGDPAQVEDFAQRFMEASPLNRPVTPEDVAETVAFLASPGARAITGEVVHVAAGSQMAVRVKTAAQRRVEQHAAIESEARS